MSRTTVAVNSLSSNAGTALTKTYLGGGLTGSDGYSLTSVRDEDLRVVIINEGATGVWTIKGGSETGYCGASEGALNVVIGGGGISKCIGPIDGSRFRNNDGTVYLDSGATGTMYAFQ